jgi:hypothetical protein
MIVKPILFTIMEHELLSIPEHLRSALVFCADFYSPWGKVVVDIE